MYWPQNVGRGVYFLLRCTKNVGGRGNPFSAIGANAFRTTNSQSRSAMRGTEFHGNTRRDSTTRIHGIKRPNNSLMRMKYHKYIIGRIVDHTHCLVAHHKLLIFRLIEYHWLLYIASSHLNNFLSIYNFFLQFQNISSSVIKLGG